MNRDAAFAAQTLFQLLASHTKNLPAHDQIAVASEVARVCIQMIEELAKLMEFQP